MKFPTDILKLVLRCVMTYMAAQLKKPHAYCDTKHDHALLGTFQVTLPDKAMCEQRRYRVSVTGSVFDVKTAAYCCLSG